MRKARVFGTVLGVQDMVIEDVMVEPDRSASRSDTDAHRLPAAWR